MKLLIFEDNPGMLRIMRNLLEDIAELHERNDGSEAVSAYSDVHPDWVLMDIRMRKVGGIRATREIKEVFPDARIIIVTNYDDTELREAAHQAGACDYVLKENIFALRALLVP